MFPISGTFGAGVTIVLQGNEMVELKEIENQCNTTIKPLPGTNVVSECFLLVFKKNIPVYDKGGNKDKFKILKQDFENEPQL